MNDFASGDRWRAETERERRARWDREYGTGPAGDEAEPKPELRIRSDWKTPPPPRRELVKRYLTRGRIALLAGDGGSGKTNLAIQLTYNTSADTPSVGGRRWFPGGPEIDGGPQESVTVSWEDDADEIQRRMLCNPDIGSAADLDARIGGRFAAIDAGDCGPVWSPDTRLAYGRLTEFGSEIQKFSERHRARLLVLDAVDSANACNENDRAAVRAFLGCWDTWGRHNDCTVLLIAHPPKNEARYSGSTAWRNGVRTLLTFERPNDADDKAILTIDKANYGKRGVKQVVAGWRWWHATSDDPNDLTSDDDEEIKALILDALRDHSPLSQRALCDAVGKRGERTRKIARAMYDDGTIHLDVRPNGHFYSLSASGTHL